MTALTDLLYPSSVAVVGASDDPTRIGGRPISYFLKCGFDGPIYPVNPRRDTVQGLPAYPDMVSLPGPADFVVVAVQAAQVIDVTRAAAAQGAKTVMIFSSDFAEAGPEGVARQNELTAIAAETGVRIVGPNCLGLFNSAHNFYATFTGSIDRGPATPGGISIVSQSGAYGSHIFYVSKLRGLGIRYWVTTGNECDLHTAEVLGMLARSDEVHTIMAYAESIKDGPLLVDALETARQARKPVIFMKVGRTEIGAAAASSHTASLAGEDAVYDAILRQYGCLRARTTEEMLDIAYACRPRLYPAGKKVGLVTISGGAGVLMADAATDAGLDVAPMPEAAQVALKELVPFASPRNPVDVTAQFFNDMTLVPKFTEAMLDQGGYDGLIGFWTSVASNPKLTGGLLDALTDVMDGREDVPFIQSLVAPREIEERYEAAGYPCFEDPTRAVNAMAALMFLGGAFARPPEDQPDVPAAEALPDGPLNEAVAKRLLASSGLPMVEDRLARSAKEAHDIAESLHGPVAMKILSADIQHKTEAGGVALHVPPDQAAQTYVTLTANASHYDPSAHIDGVLIAPMVNGGVEVILGARVDPVFGPVVLVGLGGVFTEILKDVSFRKAPVSEATAREMIGELRGVAMLRGARGKRPVDEAALAEAISRLSVFAVQHEAEIESVEMNPVRAMADKCLALDALIVRRT